MRNPGRQRGDVNNNNAAADAVKTRNRGHDAMTAGEARELAHAAREEHNVHFQGDGDASAVVDGAEGGSNDAVDDFSAPLPLRKPRIEATQFKWTQLQVGGPAPGFRGTAVVDGDFQEIALEDYRGKWLIFFFYPLDFTFVCPTEIIAFSDRFPEFEALNAAVIACSTDSHFSHLAWTNTPRNRGGLGPMSIPILANKTGEIARRWGVMKEDEGNAFRGLFIVDPAGNLRQITINDMMVGRNIDETLRLLQAFQFTDENGEVCPMNWKPGAKTIKPDPEGCKDYFNAAGGNGNATGCEENQRLSGPFRPFADAIKTCSLNVDC